jgi:hypothetical protein
MSVGVSSWLARLMLKPSEALLCIVPRAVNSTVDGVVEPDGSGGTGTFGVKGSAVPDWMAAEWRWRSAGMRTTSAALSLEFIQPVGTDMLASTCVSRTP